jgi:hypothetical protein
LNPPLVEEGGGLGADEEEGVEVEVGVRVEEALAVGFGSSQATHFSTSEALEIMHVGQSHFFKPPGPPEGLGVSPAAAQLKPPLPVDEAGAGTGLFFERRSNLGSSLSDAFLAESSASEAAAEVGRGVEPVVKTKV